MRARRLGKVSRFQHKCDDEFSKLVRSQGKCERCGSREGLDAAHVVGRKNLNLRWNILNVICLCRRCHSEFAHRYPKKFSLWFESTYPERVEYLQKTRYLYRKRTMADYEELLSAIKKRDFKSLV
jgi:5-methylcytosine-specific restriction endonuclease McrA